MNRIGATLFLLAAASLPVPGATILPAHAVCTADGLINTCLDGEAAANNANDNTNDSDDGEEEVYERLDGGSYGGRPAEAKAGKTITIGDTTVTLGQTEEKDEPWQPFNREFGDTNSLAPEDRARESKNPMQFKCYADGCY